MSCPSVPELLARNRSSAGTLRSIGCIFRDLPSLALLTKTTKNQLFQNVAHMKSRYVVAGCKQSSAEGCSTSRQMPAVCGYPSLSFRKAASPLLCEVSAARDATYGRSLPNKSSGQEGILCACNKTACLSIQGQSARLDSLTSILPGS